MTRSQLVSAAADGSAGVGPSRGCEAIGRQLTELQNGNGVVLYVPSGEIHRVGSTSQGCAPVVDMPGSHRTDRGRCREVRGEVADAVHTDVLMRGGVPTARAGLR